jgi:hypothetical protein
MPATDFFAEDEDLEGVLEQSLEMGFRLVPNLTYETPEPVECHDWDSFQYLRSQAKLFFLLHDETNLSPLSIFQIKGSGWNAGKYAIEQKQGGPSLKLSCYPAYEKDNLRWLPTSFISYYAVYRNTLTGEYEKIPKKLRDMYHEIAKYIKQHSELIEREATIGVGILKYWLMEHARESVKNGTRLGELPDFRV